MAEMDPKSRDAIKKHAATAREARVEVVRQMSILWEARLDMAMASGDQDAVSRVMNESAMRAEAYMDNCNCGAPPAFQTRDV